MDYIEVSGKNVDEALTNALIKLETTSDKVEYEVIEKGSAGFLGMGRKLAVIKVRKKEDKPVEANVKAKETETQKVADSSVSYEPVKAEPVNQLIIMRLRMTHMSSLRKHQNIQQLCLMKKLNAELQHF